MNTNIGSKFIQMIYVPVRISSSGKFLNYHPNWLVAERIFGKYSTLVLMGYVLISEANGMNWTDHHQRMPRAIAGITFTQDVGLKKREVISKGSWRYCYRERMVMGVSHNQQ